VNDIALLRIDPIDWKASPTIRPVCLPADLGEDYVDATATIVGWGSTQFGEEREYLYGTCYACRGSIALFD
jgi:hypothetical protein